MEWASKQHTDKIIEMERSARRHREASASAVQVHCAITEPADGVSADYAENFEDALEKQIVRNQEVLDACEEITTKGLTPRAWAFLDVWDGHDCQPSTMSHTRRADRIEYIAEYLRLRPYDKRALAIAETEGVLITTTDFCAVQEELYADALAVDEAQSEQTDWRG